MRLPDTEFTQYGGTFRLNYAPTSGSQLTFHYQRGQQDDGKRYDQLLGGDGNLIADLRNLMLDFGYLRFVKSNFFGFDSASFTASYNSQREERVNQGGQGDPLGEITHQYEHTSATGASSAIWAMRRWSAQPTPGAPMRPVPTSGTMPRPGTPTSMSAKIRRGCIASAGFTPSAAAPGSWSRVIHGRT